MTLLIACAVAVLVIVAAVAATFLARRSSKRADRRVAELVENLNTRIDELAKELAGAREQAEGELRRNRLLIACRVAGDEFAVVLPESTPGDAEQLYRRIQHAVS